MAGSSGNGGMASVCMTPRSPRIQTSCPRRMSSLSSRRTAPEDPTLPDAPLCPESGRFAWGPQRWFLPVLGRDWEQSLQPGLGGGALLPIFPRTQSGAFRGHSHVPSGTSGPLSLETCLGIQDAAPPAGWRSEPGAQGASGGRQRQGRSAPISCTHFSEFCVLP